MRCITRVFGTCILAACSGGTPATEAVVVRDSAGIEIVESYQPIWQPGEEWVVSTRPVLTIANEAMDHAQQVQAATRMPNGSIVVLGETPALWFDATGTLLGTIARPGDGPGEMRYATGLLRLADSVAVTAGGYFPKVVIFGPDRILVREQLTDMTAHAKLATWIECGRLEVLPDLSSLRCALDPGEERRAPDPGPGLLRAHNRIVRVPVTLDTVIPLGIDIGLEQFGVDVGRPYTEFFLHPFYARTTLSVGGSPLRIAILTNPAYEVEIWTPDGRLERLIRRPGGRRAPSVAEVTDAEKWILEQYLQQATTRDDSLIAERGIAEMPTPDSLPTGRYLLTTPRGEIVLWRHTGEWTSSTIADVFDPDGRWLGTIDTPEWFRPMEIGDDYLLGVRFDEDFVPSIEIYEIERGEG